ncbi:MAG TPA: hypothetical protein VF618_12940 [Thermoanaerobaculia bacterium]
MKLKNLIAATSIALLPLAASAATIVVPAAGSGPGANNSRWQSELTIHNTGSTQAIVMLTFHEAKSSTSPQALTIGAKSTVSLDDVVRTRFGKDVATGGILIGVADADLRRLAVNSRTFNESAEGEFGQDIPGVRSTDAATSGDVIVLAAPSSVGATRFNFGVFAIETTSVRWHLLRADGTVVATKDVTYAAGEHNQYNSGVQTFLGATAQNDDTVHARVLSGRAVFYGSAINQRSNDPTFVPGIRTREDIRINFAGIDLDENGTVDVADADGDGVLDQALALPTSSFPAFFRVVATGEHGEAVTYELISSSADAAIVGDIMQVAATGELKNTSSAIVLRATAGSSSSLLTIPVNYK